MAKLTAILATLLFACGPISGDRAGDGDGDGDDCPAGEVCSDLTPDGLFFEGQQLGDLLAGGGAGANPTAIGGLQTFEIFADEERTPFDLALDAAIDDSATGEVVAIDGNRVTVRAKAAGGFQLRIVDPETGDLFDRVTLDSAEPASVRLAPSLIDVLADLEGVGDPENPPLHYLGGESTAVFAIEDAGGDRLVDESIEAPAALAASEAWDTFTGPLSASIDVEVAGADYSLEVETTGTIEAISRTVDQPIDLATDTAAPVCFRATDGGRAILGAPWSFAATGSLSLAPFADIPADNCVEVSTSGPETATLSATADDLTTDFDVTVGAQLASGPAVGRDASYVGKPIAGDRAR